MGPHEHLTRRAPVGGSRRGDLPAFSALSSSDLGADLAAIRESFDVLRDEDVSLWRGRDERARHLERGRRPTRRAVAASPQRR